MRSSGSEDAGSNEQEDEEEDEDEREKEEDDEAQRSIEPSPIEIKQTGQGIDNGETGCVDLRLPDVRVSCAA